MARETKKAQGPSAFLLLQWQSLPGLGAKDSCGRSRPAHGEPRRLWPYWGRPG